MMYHSPSLYCSHLDSLLSQENLSLDDILSDSDVIDECKAENKTLLAFITQSHHLRKLVENVVSGADATAPIPDQFRRCHVASELLSSGVPRVSYALLRDSESLDILYAHLHNQGLTHLSASFVYRIISTLIQYSSDEVHTYFAQKSDLSQCLLINIDKPSIMDLFFNLVQSQSNPEISLQLSDSTLISDLIGLLSLEQSDETHASVLQCLCGLLASSRISHRSPSDVNLTRRNRLQEKLESLETIQSLSARIFDLTNGQIVSDSLLINGLLYFRCLIDPTARAEASPELAPLPRNDSFYLWSDRVGTTLCEALLPNLVALKHRLLVSTKIPSVPNGSIYPTGLTAARLHIARFVPYLITANSDALVHEMLNLDLVNILLDLFFHFPLNSFLHSACECLVRQIVLRAILNSSCSPSSDPSPRNTVLFSSTDAFHQQFFNPADPPSETISSQQDDNSRSQSNDNRDTQAVDSEPQINVFWRFLDRLLVEGNLLTRIVETWNTTSFPSNRGHMRLIANLLTTAIGPCPEAYEDDTLGSSEHQILLITPEHMVTAATNGCRNECDSNPALRSFLRSRLSDDTWTTWCEFVRGPLMQSNEKCYVNYAEFPNSVASSEQNLTEYKLTDLAISHALQNAFSNYYSQPLTPAFAEQFGFAEDEFVETLSHPHLILDSRLNEVSFSLHINEDTENGSLFEQACNDVIQLNEKEVGLDKICLSEPSSDLVSKSEDVTAPLADPGVKRSLTESSFSLPSRAKLLEVFDEVQAGVSNVFADEVSDAYMDDDTNSDEDLDAVLVNCPRLTTGRQLSRISSDDGTPETNVLLNGFDHALRLKNLPTLAESDGDEMEDECVGTNDQDNNDSGDSDDGYDAWRTTENSLSKENGKNNSLSGTRRKNPMERSASHLTETHVPMHAFYRSGCQQLSSMGDDKSGKSRQFMSSNCPSTVDKRDLEGAELSTTEGDLEKPSKDILGLENGVYMTNGLVEDRNDGNWMEIHRLNDLSVDVETGSTAILGADETHSSPPAVPLSAWKTHMVLTHQSNAVNPSTPHRLSQPPGLTRSELENCPEDMDAIELGDLSAGLSHLARSSTKTASVLQSKQMNWVTDHLVGTPRSLIMPTKRSSVNRSHPEGYVNPLCALNISPRLTDKHMRASSHLDPSSSPPVSRVSPTEPITTRPAAEYSRLSSHFASKSPHMSCGILATVKVRHGTKAHNLPPFVISENELNPNDLTGSDDHSTTNSSISGDGLNGFDSSHIFDSDSVESEPSSDPNSTKARYRSHRTIKLRPGSEGQVGELNG